MGTPFRVSPCFAKAYFIPQYRLCLKLNGHPPLKIMVSHHFSPCKRATRSLAKVRCRNMLLVQLFSGSLWHSLSWLLLAPHFGRAQTGPTCFPRKAEGFLALARSSRLTPLCWTLRRCQGGEMVLPDVACISPSRTLADSACRLEAMERLAFLP